MKILTIYYSYGGNTRKIAERVQKTIGGDIAEIKTVKPYVGSYDEIVEQGEREVNSGFMPEVLPLDKNPQDYDVIVIGSPVWWYTFAPAVKTTLCKENFSGKKVYPFATNGGWVGHTAKDFERELRGASVAKLLNVRFDENRQVTPDSTVDAWINSIGE